MLGGGPPDLFLPDQITVTRLALNSVGFEADMLTVGGGVSTAFGAGSAGFVCYVPFRIREPVLVTKMFCMQGATANGNVDMGIYDFDGNLLTSCGTTAQGTVNKLQTIDVTDIWLYRGTYYMAHVGSSATGTVFSDTSAIGVHQAMGCLEQGGVTLPLSTGASPATFAKYSRAFMPWFGYISGRELGV